MKQILVGLLLVTGVGVAAAAPRGLVPRCGNPRAFGRRCIPPPPQRGCRVGGPGAGGVARRSNIPDMLAPRALPAGRIAALGAHADFRNEALRGPAKARHHVR